MLNGGQLPGETGSSQRTRVVTREQFEQIEADLRARLGEPDQVIDVPGKGRIDRPDRALRRFEGLRIGNKLVVDRVDAFGSRAGSTYRGREPLESSDLDLLIAVDPNILVGRNGAWVRGVLESIAEDFEAEAGFELSLHAPENRGVFLKSVKGATLVPQG